MCIGWSRNLYLKRMRQVTKSHFRKLLGASDYYDLCREWSASFVKYVQWSRVVDYRDKMLIYYPAEVRRGEYWGLEYSCCNTSILSKCELLHYNCMNMNIVG